MKYLCLVYAIDLGTPWMVGGALVTG